MDDDDNDDNHDGWMLMMMTMMMMMNLCLVDLQRQLAASKEKNAELLDDRSKLVSFCFPQKCCLLFSVDKIFLGNRMRF